jgi:hypothetical protein
VKAAARAVSPATSDTARERAITAQNFVLEKLAIWQRRLKLQDWDISATLVRQKQLKPKTLGNIDWDTPTKTAHIHVLALEDYKMSYKDALTDMEFTVVHELVHLALSDLPRSEASRGAEEHAVNRIAQTMLDLVRSGGK